MSRSCCTCHARVTCVLWAFGQKKFTSWDVFTLLQDIEQVFFRIHNRATSTIDAYIPAVVRGRHDQPTVVLVVHFMLPACARWYGSVACLANQIRRLIVAGVVLFAVLCVCFLGVMHATFVRYVRPPPRLLRPLRGPIGRRLLSCIVDCGL
jgi:hypothetical protein